MKRYVPYRFPSLAAVRRAAAPAPRPDEAGAASNAAQADAERAACEAAERGYRDGYASGEREGRDAGFTRGHDDGVQRGADEARRAATSRFDGLARTVDTLITALGTMQHEMTASMHDVLLDLVGKVAHQVVRCELRLQPSQLVALIDEAIATMPPATERVEIYLNPEECERVKALAPERASHWTLVPDGRLDSGECRIKAGSHEVDAGCGHRLDTCLEQVREQFGQAREAAAPAPAAAAAQPPGGAA